MEEVSGEEIQETNMLVSRAFSDIFESTLGPIGLNKLIIKEDIDLVSSNGLYILKEMEDTHKYDHPTAKILINAGKSVGEVVGDGVSTVMILIGELVKEGFKLKSMGVPFPTIVKSYSMAAKFCEELLDEIATRASKTNELLLNVARTALKQHRELAPIVVNCIERIGDELPIDVDDVTIVAEAGASVSDTKFVEGVVVDRSALREDAPTHIEDARIALLNLPIERKKMRSDASFEISDPSQIRALRAEERDSLDEIISSIISSGANVVCCQKGMDDEAVDRLSNAGVLVLKRVKNTDMRRLERSTAAKTVDDINELTPSKLGKARVVERKIGRSKMVLFEDCPFHKSSAIVIRGNDIHVLEGIVSEVKSALHCTAIVSEDQRILPGGGAVEIEVARRLRKRVSTIAGKEKLGVEVFASALEVIPRVLVKNAGMDPLDCVAKLRSEHEGDNPNMGICVEHRRIMDMLEEGVIEPLYVKSQAINSAASVAMGMLRIDDLVIAKQKEKTGLRMEYEAPEFKYRRGRIKY